jgi:hypothetical protein
MLKERLSGSSYSSPDELICAIGAVIASIPKDELVGVYEKLDQADQMGDRASGGVLPQVSKRTTHYLPY